MNLRISTAIGITIVAEVMLAGCRPSTRSQPAKAMHAVPPSSSASTGTRHVRTIEIFSGGGRGSLNLTISKQHFIEQSKNRCGVRERAGLVKNSALAELAHLLESTAWFRENCTQEEVFIPRFGVTIRYADGGEKTRVADYDDVIGDAIRLPSVAKWYEKVKQETGSARGLSFSVTQSLQQTELEVTDETEREVAGALPSPEEIKSCFRDADTDIAAGLDIFVLAFRWQQEGKPTEFEIIHSTLSKEETQCIQHQVAAKTIGKLDEAGVLKILWVLVGRPPALAPLSDGGPC